MGHNRQSIFEKLDNSILFHRLIGKPISTARLFQRLPYYSSILNTITLTPTPLDSSDSEVSVLSERNFVNDLEKKNKNKKRKIDRDNRDSSTSGDFVRSTDED